LVKWFVQIKQSPCFNPGYVSQYGLSINFARAAEAITNVIPVVLLRMQSWLSHICGVQQGTLLAVCRQLMHIIHTRATTPIIHIYSDTVPDDARLECVLDTVPERVTALLLQQIVAHHVRDKLPRLVRYLQSE